MSAIIAFWFFGIWTALFVGAALTLIGFDTWLNHRRDVVRRHLGNGNDL